MSDEAIIDARAGASALTNRATQIEYACADGDWLEAARLIGTLGAVLPDLIADVIQAAYDANPKITKKELARLVHVPPRDLTGLRRSVTA